MPDLSEHPFSPENVLRESGAPDGAERAWFQFANECRRLLGHDIDGNDIGPAGCGYSLDEAYSSFEASDTAAQYVSRVRRRERYDGGAFFAS